jgi:hypothetical protein
MSTLVGRNDQTRQQRQGRLQQIAPISESKNDGGGATNKGRDISGRASACPERSTEEGKHAAGAREHPQLSAATDPDLAPLDGVPKYSLEWFQIKREIEASSKRESKRVSSSTVRRGEHQLLDSSGKAPMNDAPPSRQRKAKTTTRQIEPSSSKTSEYTHNTAFDLERFDFR